MHLIFNFCSGLQGKAGDCNKYSTWQSQPEGVLWGILKNTLQRPRWVCTVSIPKTPVGKQRDSSLSPLHLSQHLWSRLHDCPQCSSSERFHYLMLVSRRLGQLWNCHPGRSQSYQLCRRQLSLVGWHIALRESHGLGDIKKQGDRGISWRISIYTSRS